MPRRNPYADDDFSNVGDEDVPHSGRSILCRTCGYEGPSVRVDPVQRSAFVDTLFLCFGVLTLHLDQDVKEHCPACGSADDHEHRRGPVSDEAMQIYQQAVAQINRSDTRYKLGCLLVIGVVVALFGCPILAALLM